VVGSVTFLATSFIIAATYLAAYSPQAGLGRALLAAGAASLAGTAAELLSTRLDDNLTVPIASVMAAALFL
jgi:dolichol kinase